MRLSEHDQLYEKDIDNHAVSKNNFDYYTNDKFHKLIINSSMPRGFQKNKSTTLAILDVTTKLIHAIENKNFSCTIFLDFAKAFDTVDHEILLYKLEYYGIRGIALKWFRSYLKRRKQSVLVGGELSEKLNITYGVPQGSVLGPLLFLLYINDIPNSTKTFDFHLFANDTSLLMSH